jgi:hypothetical protein
MEAQSNKQCSFFDGTIRDTTTTTAKQGKQPTATSRKPGKKSAANQVRTVSLNICKHVQTLSNLLECEVQKIHLYLL